VLKNPPPRLKSRADFHRAAELESANAMVHNTLRSVLEELYRAFRDSGEATFGNWFFQNGGFHHFVHFVYVYSVLSF
jgi:hypothetical protein